MTPILVRDLLMNMLLGLTALVILVLAQVNPKDDESKSIPPPGNLAVLACWPEGNTDIDVWGRSPEDDLSVGYSRKSGRILSLLRDDLGLANDATPVNCENMFARETPEGEWIFNLHGFRLPNGPVMVHVEVALGRSAEAMTLLVSTEILVKPGQEITVIRFRLDGEGNVIPGSENRVYRELRSAGK